MVLWDLTLGLLQYINFSADSANLVHNPKNDYRSASPLTHSGRRKIRKFLGKHESIKHISIHFGNIGKK